MKPVTVNSVFLMTEERIWEQVGVMGTADGQQEAVVSFHILKTSPRDLRDAI